MNKDLIGYKWMGDDGRTYEVIGLADWGDANYVQVDVTPTEPGQIERTVRVAAQVRRHRELSG